MEVHDIKFCEIFDAQKTVRRAYHLNMIAGMELILVMYHRGVHTFSDIVLLIFVLVYYLVHFFELVTPPVVHYDKHTHTHQMFVRSPIHKACSG